MDKEACWEATEDDFIALGLTSRGDVIKLKSFCMSSKNEEGMVNELADAIKFEMYILNSSSNCTKKWMEASQKCRLATLMRMR